MQVLSLQQPAQSRKRQWVYSKGLQPPARSNICKLCVYHNNYKIIYTIWYITCCYFFHQ